MKQPITDLPLLAVPLKTLFPVIRLFLQILIGFESTNKMPVIAKATGFGKNCHCKKNTLHQF